MNSNEMSITFPALSKNEAFARSVAAAFAVQLDPTIEELTDVRTAVSEAVTNAIIHGYSSRGGTVRMDCYTDGDMITIIVTDYGKGIADIEQAMQPFFTTLASEERSGMGFTVMQTFMDEVEVNSRPGGGTVVKMKKRLVGKKR